MHIRLGDCPAHQCWSVGQLWLMIYKKIQPLSVFGVVNLPKLSLFFMGHRLGQWVVNLPERTESGLIAGSNQTVRAVHSCNSWF